jgi:repressor LexA
MQYGNYQEKIFDFYSKHKRMPSYAEIMDLLNFKSKNAVYKLVQKLIDGGIVTKDSKGKLVPAFGFGELPLLGVVEAGIPSIVDAQELDAISLDNYLVDHKAKTFLLEVKGDSMIEAHIEEGDLVVAERAETAKNNDIVIAEVDGEWTMKYLKKDMVKNTMWLEPANKNYKPIYPEQSLRIAAVVKGVIRKYS